mgnify:CR=1 FL=1
MPGVGARRGGDFLRILAECDSVARSRRLFSHCAVGGCVKTDSRAAEGQTECRAV